MTPKELLELRLHDNQVDFIKIDIENECIEFAFWKYEENIKNSQRMSLKFHEVTSLNFSKIPSFDDAEISSLEILKFPDMFNAEFTILTGSGNPNYTIKFDFKSAELNKI